MKIKVQLFLLADDSTDLSLIKQDLSGYYRVDVLYWGEFSLMMATYRDLSGPNFHLHKVNLDVAHHINQFVSKDCSYYVVSETLTDLNRLPAAIEKSLNNEEMPLLLIKPLSEIDYTGLVVNTMLHNFLYGFGIEQTIMEKIEIFAKNYNISKHIYNCLADFYCEQSIIRIGKEYARS